ncbi:MAG TPA: GDP-mannose 4,6-dehydratase [Chitinophagaceae bacterium]|nr:GDP-mannose 4,6-dehydratase [Chitinophagaceae bacterium]
MVIVTGCAGFIGSHVCEKLLHDGEEVIGIDNFDSFYERFRKEENLKSSLQNSRFRFVEADICSPEVWDSFRSLPVKGVIHLAAKAGVLPSLQNPEAYMHTNLQGTYQVLNFLQQMPSRKLVFASSSSIYGNNDKIPFAENDVVDHPISPYAFTKKSNELQIHTWHHLYQIDAVCLRFFTVYGPRQRPDLAIRKFIHQIEHNQPIEIYGDGSTSRDYTYIEDTVAGVLSAWKYVQQHQPVYEIINLGNHTPVALQELVQLIYELLHKQPDIRYSHMKPGDVTRTFANIHKAKELLGYHPRTPIKEGLKKYILWYKQNQ